MCELFACKGLKKRISARFCLSRAKIPIMRSVLYSYPPNQFVLVIKLPQQERTQVKPDVCNNRNAILHFL
jgi:hypothetical protein